MDDITLDVPDADEFEDDTFIYIPVCDDVVDSGIKLLECFVAQWRQERESQPDAELWGRLAVSAAAMRGGLISAWTAYWDADDRGARALVDQIAWFCHWPEARSRLGALAGTQAKVHPAFQTDLEDADIVAALLSLAELSARRRNERKEHKEHKEHRQQAAAEQGPAPERDVGWEF
jgi:hypothetical protein